MIDEVIKTQEDDSSKSIERLKAELVKVRTGRASPALLDGVMVDYYGASTKLNQLANVAAPEPRLLTVQPFDKSVIQEVEKAIMAANLGLNPQTEGNLIRLPIPPLTEERRKDLVSVVKKHGEETKVAVRNHRRDANELLKTAKNDKEISEDDMKKGQDQVQKVTDKFVAEIDEIVSSKEKDILTV
jgi:ribosome recycling factor